MITIPLEKINKISLESECEIADDYYEIISLVEDKILLLHYPKLPFLKGKLIDYLEEAVNTLCVMHRKDNTTERESISTGYILVESTLIEDEIEINFYLEL
ncbi:MAG: hypothetical protein M0R17_08470 [Candidatus Omnitrophica bacterium]|jgi:hypothetical protein|nr:hypothetical protein [Candidatus Omnitrophota bacterium]